MGLAERLTSSTNTYNRNTQCQTCRFYEDLSEDDRIAFDEWIAAKHNLAELHRMCMAEGLKVTYKNFTVHFENGHHGVS